MSDRLWHLEDVRVEDAFEGFGIIVDAEQEHSRLLRGSIIFKKKELRGNIPIH